MKEEMGDIGFVAGLSWAVKGLTMNKIDFIGKLRRVLYIPWYICHALLFCVQETRNTYGEWVWEHKVLV